MNKSTFYISAQIHHVKMRCLRWTICIHFTSFVTHIFEISDFTVSTVHCKYFDGNYNSVTSVSTVNCVFRNGLYDPLQYSMSTRVVLRSTVYIYSMVSGIM